MSERTQTADPISTLFRLRNLNGQSTWSVGEGQQIFRIDQPQRREPKSTRQSQPKLQARPRSRRRVDESDRVSESPVELRADLTNEHATDLLEQLRQWSMDLDRREAELDDRERQLNRRLRLARQIES